jgi:hypothetical protein
MRTALNKINDIYKKLYDNEIWELIIIKYLKTLNIPFSNYESKFEYNTKCLLELPCDNNNTAIT